MSVTLNTQLEEQMYSSQIISTRQRLSHKSKLYGVRLAQVFPTSNSRRAIAHLSERATGAPIDRKSLAYIVKELIEEDAIGA